MYAPAMSMEEDIASRVSSADDGEGDGESAKDEEDKTDGEIKPGDHGKRIAAALGIKLDAEKAEALETAIKDCVEEGSDY